MKYIGIVFAISRPAGEYIESEIKKQLRSVSDKVCIVSDEQALSRYQSATTSFSLARVLYDSIDKILKKIPPHEPVAIILGANSVHSALSELRELISHGENNNRIHLISMIEATVFEVQLRNSQSVTVLGSNKTISSQLYHNPLRAEKFNVIDLTFDAQTQIDAFIKKGISCLTSDEERRIIELIQEHKKRTGVETMIFGCAEFGEKFNEINLQCKVINSSNALIATTVTYIMNNSPQRSFRCKL